MRLRKGLIHQNSDVPRSRPLRGLSALVLAVGMLLAAGADSPDGRARSVPLPRLVGQSIMTGFPGREPPPDLLARIKRGEIGGVILFGENIGSPAALRALVSKLQAVAKAGGNPPLLVAVDQEGGLVRRLPAGPPDESAAAMGRRDPARVRREGIRTGQYLSALGIGVDLAPVADVPDSSQSFLGSRAFGSSVSRVAPRVASFAAGLQQAHVAATLKHFPGLGTARANTDLARVVIRSGRAELERRLRPFRQGIKAGARLVMVSNAVYPALDASARPALFSRAIVTSLLRKRLGFDGVVITDAMEAPAPAAFAGAPAAALAAGVDVLLYTSESAGRQGFDQLLAAARAKPGIRADLQAAYARIGALKDWSGG